MKKKFIILTLCFTLVFSSINYKKSYADGGVISLPVLATVSSLAVGAGIVINSNDDLYNLGSLFDKYNKLNDMTFDALKIAFEGVKVLGSGFVSVDSNFLDYCKGFFDFVFSNPASSSALSYPYYIVYKGVGSEVGKSLVYYCNGLGISSSYPDFYNGCIRYTYLNGQHTSTHSWTSGTIQLDSKYYVPYSSNVSFIIDKYGISDLGVTGAISGSFDYQGGYNWDYVESKKDNESVALPIPGNLGQLVGQGSDDFWDNTDNLVGNGDLSLPSVDDPSIGIDDSVSFPGASSPDVPDVDSPSVPNEGIWATIKDFIIGLVVPGDTYWTDTWGGLYNNFTNSFPMVDMDGFNDLLTGEKKFPNIDINIMGVNGRIVNGDVINSIVDWLRPILAGFMMLCLMLFNYRKIYKLIRNSEPFGGIAPGTSDFSTGISEYSKQEVFKATDMVSEYRAWRERGGK